MLTLALLAALQGANPLAVLDDSLRPNVNVLAYDIAVAIPDSGTMVRGRTTIQARVRSTGAPLALDFDTAFTIDGITRTPNDRGGVTVTDWRWTAGGGIAIPLHARVGDTVTFAITYHGHPTDGLFIQRDVHGDRTAFADNWPDRAHHWFPSIDHPSDKARARFEVEVPAGWRAIANGALEGVDTLRSGRTRWRWVEHHPIPVYTMVVGAGRLAVTQEGRVDDISVSVWTYPADSAFAVDGPFRHATKIIRTFVRLFGPFPYEKLAHVESSTRFGGMENSTAIFYDEKAYASGRMREATVAHESAHQWFGDAVTERDWHHLWLSEGFATYFAAVYDQQRGDDSLFHAAMERAKRGYFASADTARPVIDTAVHNLFQLLNRNNYQKGAWILHTLRGEIGDSAFFRGVRAYYRTYRDSTALSSDFDRVMSRAAGRSLDWFFQQWLLQPGYPRLEAHWTYDAVHQSARITVREVQSTAWGTYRLTVPAELILANGVIVNFDMRVAGRETTVTRTGITDEPKHITLDPHGDLLIEQVHDTGSPAQGAGG